VARRPAEPIPRHWILVGGGAAAGELAAGLHAVGDRCVLAEEAAGAVAALEQSRIDGVSTDGVLHLAALDAAGDAAAAADAMDAAALEAAQERLSGSGLGLVQALARSGAHTPLVLVTRGAQAIRPGDAPDPVQAALWGLGLVAALEHPELRSTRVDLDPRPGADLAAGLRLALACGEDRVAVRGGDVHVPRLRRATAAVRLPEAPYRLDQRGARLIDGLEWAPSSRQSPEAGEVEVRVEVTGLAFRDVLHALGEYPEPDAPIGGEFAGTVVAIGPGVADRVVGERVWGMAPGAFRSHLTVGAALVRSLPAGFTPVDAVGLPSYVTAVHALRHVAALRAGERVLVHAGAGGVGLAAVRVARAAGAEVYATAGSEEKRAFLREQGVRHVYDSRSTAFADGVMRDTGGQGVQVVLNSLSGEAIHAGLRTLAQGGRFVEMGRRGVLTGAEVGALRPDVGYTALDLVATLEANPAAIGALLDEVGGGAAMGEFAPLPTAVFGSGQVADAFRHMAQAKHIGKIAVVHDAVPEVRPDATYLLTGGLGGVGLSTAAWLVGRGARTLVLAGRRAPDAAAVAAVAALEAAGARVVLARADVATEAGVAHLFDEVLAGLPPLRGVFHGALVLDDGAILQQSWARFGAVMGPRATGAWLLHRRTRHMALDFFALHSAAGAVLGSPGQANYTAANAFLDALAQHRRARGLAGLSMQWGVWSGVGRAAALGVAERGWQHGVGAMAPADALRALERACERPHIPLMAAMPVDWAAFGDRAAKPFFQHVRAASQRWSAPAEDAGPEADSTHPGAALRAELERAPAGRRQALLLAHARRQAIRVLGLEPGYTFPADTPLQELGMDSLMAVELRTLLGSGLDLSRPLPATLAFDYPSVAAIAVHLEHTLFGAIDAAPRADALTDTASAGMHVDVVDLSDSEAEAMLLAELDALRQP
jgi:NADPH:quinone reductase-like Zn-dependent oxidoreductase